MEIRNLPDMETLVALCKRRGFVFPGSEIYGGLANSWDYGPLGVELRNNIKNLWWDRFVRRRADIVGLEAAIIMNPKVWEKSGHTETFNDPLVECRSCNGRYRFDQLVDENELEVIKSISQDLSALIFNYFTDSLNNHERNMDPVSSLVKRLMVEVSEKYSGRETERIVGYIEHAANEAFNGIEYDVNVERDGSYDVGWNFKEAMYNRFSPELLLDIAQEIYLDREIKCPSCAHREWGEVRQFNLMLQTQLGVDQSSSNQAYLRPETAQGMFVDFKNVLDSTRVRLPFGIAQVGKAFRNEITPGNFIFRTREFEQMEIEYFIEKPTSDSDWEIPFEEWRTAMHAWVKAIGINPDHIHELEVPQEDLAHYSKRTIDLEYDFPFGRKELYGLAYRTDFDLKNHFEDAPYRDPVSGETSYPHVIEPTWGVDRTMLAVLADSYREVEEDEGKKRIYLDLVPQLAPYKAAVFPLLANKPELVTFAQSLFNTLLQNFPVAWDDRGNVGKRYYAQDEIGTPWCITVDFQTLEDGTVTLRDRNSGTQERVLAADLPVLLMERMTVSASELA